MDGIPDPHGRYFEYAQQLARHSDYKIKVGAVILQKGKIIARGHNKTKAPNKHFNTKWNTTHAEVAAILAGRKCNLVGTTIYVFRQDHKGNFKMARPCEYCMETLKQFGIKRIVYTTENYPYWNTELI